MQLRLISQPDRELVGNQLIEALGRPSTIGLLVASAWVRRSALRRIEVPLRSLAERLSPDRYRGLFGVDLGGTTIEGLELAAELFGEARVFHSRGNPRRVFHPKVFMIERSDSASVFIGSANLTVGGLWGNFETGVWIEAKKPADETFLDEVRQWFERWWMDPNGSLVVTGDSIETLKHDPLIRLPTEADVRRGFAKKARSGDADQSRAFDSSVANLLPIPPAPAYDHDEESEAPEVQPVVNDAPSLDGDAQTSGDHLRVLVAGIPHERWPQIGFNRQVAEEFFGVYENGDALRIEGVRQSGEVLMRRSAQLVSATSNQNRRIEFPEPDGREDPRPGRGILVVLERADDIYRYVSLRPGDDGYEPMEGLLESGSPLGTSRSHETRRVLVTSEKLRTAWSGCPL